MSHTCGRASSGKIFSIFSNQSKNTHTKCCCVTNLTAPSKNCDNLNKTDGQLKSKRLKTRKERSQMRGGWTETSKAKSRHHHCHCKSRRDTVFFQSCCHNSDHQTAKRNTPISSVVPATQEPSIITESRLIGHHRLFNHEVKSIDIERLLSKESEFKHNKKKETGENNNALNPSSASPIPVQLSSDDDVTVTEKAEPDAKTYDTPQETEVKNLPGSDVSPGQRVLQHTDVSSGGFKSIISAKHSSHSVETKKTTKCLKSTKKRKHHLTPPADLGDLKTPNSKVTSHMISDLGGPLVNQNHQIQADGLKSGLLPLSSSPTIESVNIQHRRHDHEHLAKTVTAVAARLCGSLHLPFVKRRSPLSESRNVLQKVLQKRHGPWLQANLLEIQRCVEYDINPTQTSLDTENTVMKKDERLVTDTSVRTTGSRPFSWDSSPQLHQGLQQESINPMDPSDNFLEKMFRPSFSHRCMDFEPSGAAANNLFACSSKLFQEEKASSSDFWEDLRSKKEDSTEFKASPNSFMNPTRNDADISREQQQHYVNIHPFFPFQVGRPEDLIEFHQEQNPFETDRYSLSSSISTQIQQHRQPFHQLSTHPTFRPHHDDMMLYPPSYMLELSPAPPSSSVPSPEHWSFPPMRLY